MKRTKLLAASLFLASAAVFFCGAGTAPAAALSWTDVHGVMQGNPPTVRGTASLAGLGPAIPVSYTVDASGKFTGSGNWNGVTTVWKPIPGVSGAEFRISTPAIRVSAASSPPTLSATFSVAKVEVRSTETMPNGNPWARAELSPGPVPIDADGSVMLPLPRLPQPQGQVSEAWCDAGCGVIRNLGLNLAAAVPSGTQIPSKGYLKHVNQWRSECEIWPYGAGGGNGQCKTRSTCPPGQSYFQGADQKWSCRSSVPQVPTVPPSVSMKVENLVR